MGNDVCKKKLEDMTKPEIFERQLANGLLELDRKAPRGSRLLLSGLIDARILWDEMSNRRHPLGVTYRKVYEFLTCTNANPCSTWLSVNETVRNLTFDHSEILSKTVEKVVQNIRLQNIELKYFNYNIGLRQTLEDFRRRGISPHILIEEVDGFHPSHEGHKVAADHTWKLLESYGWVGRVNPNNNLIRARFGDQGGH